MYKSSIGFLAGVVVLLAYAFYLRSIHKRETKPSVTTWGVWALLGVLVLFGYVSGGARDTAWVALANAIGPIAVFGFCLFDGVPSRERGLERRMNHLCLLLAGLGVGVWAFTWNPTFALFAFLLADFAGIFPTLLKSVLRPHEEECFSWVLFVAGDLLNVLVLSPEDPWLVSFYPWYIFVTEGAILFFTFTKLGGKIAVKGRKT